MKILVTTVLFLFVSISSYAEKKTSQRKPDANPRSKVAKAQSGTPDVFIGTLDEGIDEDCPMMIKENAFEECAKFGFVDSSLQASVRKAILAQQTQFKMSGKWGLRETGKGTKAAIFIIEFVTTE